MAPHASTPSASQPPATAHAPASLTSDPRTTCRASSVLDRNKRLYGAANVLSADATSCWTSAQGSPQQLQVHFRRLVAVDALRLMFQGGFVGQDVQLHAKRPGGSQWEPVDVDVDPEDSNELQQFPCCVEQVEALALTFQRSSDFYGRVVVYQLDVLGSEMAAVST
ncbi:hypothetical protein BBJ28_00015259 [Nothophytophthora sp. Chile5]|nr:hypothetical protein BBJ28_00015259 [Nothophytophthora sp. Chile5]